MRSVQRLETVLWWPHMRICRAVGWSAAVVGRAAEGRVCWTARWFAMALWEEVEVVDMWEVVVDMLSECHAVGDSELYYVPHLECCDVRWGCLVKDDGPVVVDVDGRAGSNVGDGLGWSKDACFVSRCTWWRGPA